MPGLHRAQKAGWLEPTQSRLSVSPGCCWPTHHHHTTVQSCLSLALQLDPALLGHCQAPEGQGTFLELLFHLF